MDRDEFLQAPHLPEPEHGSLSPSKWQVRVLYSVVCPPRGFLAILVSNHFHCGSVGSQAIRDNHFWNAISLHRFLQKRKRSLTIPPFRDEALEDFTFMIYRAPKVMLLAIDLHEDFIEMPPLLRTLAHGLRSFLLDLRREHRSETVPPVTHAFMANIYAALVQKVIDVAK